MNNIVRKPFLAKGLYFDEPVKPLKEYPQFISILEDNNKNQRTGEVRYNKFGTEMTAVDYKNNKNVTVFFSTKLPNGEIVNYIGYECRYESFNNGTLISPYDPTVKELGHLGEGKFTPSEFPRQYNTFTQMMRRCNSDFYWIDPFFYSFQNFCSWDRMSYYEFDGERMELIPNIDRTIKHYHPYTSMYVPKDIRVFLDTFLDYFHYNSETKQVKCKIRGEELDFGTFYKVEEVYEIWRNAKKEEITEMANYYWFDKGGQYKERFKMIYDIMINYTMPERSFK